MAAGPASRLGSTEPGDKTGPRPSPALALAPIRPQLLSPKTVGLDDPNRSKASQGEFR